MIDLTRSRFIGASSGETASPMDDIESEFKARGLIYAHKNIFDTPELEAAILHQSRNNAPAPFAMLHYKPLSRIDLITGVMRDLPVRRHPPVAIRSAGSAGDGLFATSAIAPGTFLGEYTGRICVVPHTEVQAVGNRNGYLFLLGLLGPFMHDGVMAHVLIDAEPAGNHTRFANHSFAPNCASGSVLLDDGWHVFLATNRAVMPGEQLVYDYGKAYWTNRPHPLAL